MNEENFNLADREINIKDKGSIKKGIGLIVLSHIIYAGLLFLGICLSLIFVKQIGLWYIAIVFHCIALGCFIWLIQLIYVIPVSIYFRKQKETLKGILIASGITFLLGGGICGEMLSRNMFG